MEKIKFLLVDDQEIILDGLVNCIKKEFTEPDIFSANTCISAKEILKNQKIDFLISDITMETKNSGIELCSFAKLNFPDIKIIVFSQYDNPYNIYELYKLGIRVFLDKFDLKKDFSKAIFAVNNNQKFYTQRLQFIIENYFKSKNCKLANDKLPQLTDRQLEYLELIITGLTDEEIAEKLNVSKSAVHEKRKEFYQIFEIDGNSKIKITKLITKVRELGFIN